MLANVDGVFPLTVSLLGLPSAAIFTFHKEDHTLGNMLRQRLLKTAHVIFAAYRVSNLLYAHGVGKILTTIH
jgi:DNA-directed RNA polymerase subunit L